MDRELISDAIYSDLSALTGHDRVPTNLELDRFIRGLGYRKITGEPPVLSDEEQKRIINLNTELGNRHFYEAGKRLCKAQLDADKKFYQGKNEYR